MRILALQETDWLERNPILHHRMLESLAVEGHDVTVIDYDILWAQRGRWPLWQARRVWPAVHRFFPAARVRVIRPPMLRVPGLGRLSWLVGNWLELRRLFRTARPDVVVAYGISNAYLALRLARLARTPFVYHVLDALHTLGEPAPLRLVARVVERAVMREADRVIVVNNSLRDYALAMGAAPERVETIPMGASVPDTLPDGEAMRARLGLQPSDFVLLFMGWLYTFSGLRELTRALARRRAELPSVRLLVVGDGDLLAALRQARGELGLERELLLTGRRPLSEMPAYIAASDVGLLPAHKNATMKHIVPAKVIEYMALGRPVIATRQPGLEAEFGGLPGMLYIDAPEQALDRVAELLRAPGDPRATARRLGATCSAFIRGRDDWEGVTARFKRVLESTRPRAVAWVRGERRWL